MRKLLLAVSLLCSLVAQSRAADAPAEKPAIRAARSVHLGYEAPEAKAYYNEMTVERSVPGSYFMACGFHLGYFGIQELGNGKKVVLFSVWDPTKGDNPNNVPDDQRVEVVYKADDVRVKRFGGEGTGGQSFFDFDWKLGDTYRFYVTAKPEGDKTSFAGYIYLPEQKAWKHLVTFRTLSKGLSLRGAHSFVEDFRRDVKSAGEVRRASFGNGWVLDTKDAWHPLLKARFTGSSATWEAMDTVDAGVTESNRFYLQTGGDTAMSRKVGSSITREAGKEEKPAVPE